MSRHHSTAAAATADASCAPDCPLADALDRRSFIAKSALAAAAAALAACGGGGGGADVTAPTSVGSSIGLASYPALANTGGVAVVSVSGTRLAIVRTGTSSFVALSLVCPHEGGSIDQSGTGFLCSKHGARFSATGTWTGGERTSNMRSYPVTYDATAGTLAIG